MARKNKGNCAIAFLVLLVSKMREHNEMKGREEKKREEERREWKLVFIYTYVVVVSLVVVLVVFLVVKLDLKQIHLMMLTKLMLSKPGQT